MGSSSLHYDGQSADSGECCKVKRLLRVAFAPTVTRWNDIIGSALSAVYECVPDEQDPEVLFVSDTDPDDPRAGRAKTILVSIENSWPDFNKHVAGLNFSNTNHPRVLRLPLYALVARPEELIKTPDFAERVAGEPRRFCAFVASNRNVFRTRERVRFFKALHKRQAVDSGGVLFNNIGHRAGDLREFYRQYRFCITFENHSFPGYTTEKIVYAMRSGCIPIYWGNPSITEDFNPGSFINVHDFRNNREAIDYIINVSRSPELINRYLLAPYLPGNRPTQWFDSRRVSAFLQRIIEAPRPPRKGMYHYHLWHRYKLKLLPYLPSGFLKS